MPAVGGFQISQSFNGRFSHDQQPSQFAVDFSMDVGVDIRAARDGTVIVAKDNYNFGGKSDYFLDKANHVMVLHADGSIAVYAHILSGSATVSHGDQVVAGQRIARSGESGFTTGPHLHFALLRNVGAVLMSVPFQFKDAQGNPFTPQRGMTVVGSQ